MDGMKRVWLLSLAMVCGAIAPVARAQKQAAGPANNEVEDDVREAVFRYQFKSLQVEVSFYFVSVDNKNPGPALLDRFREDQPEVRPASDAKYEKKPVAGFVEKRTDKQGIMFRQGAIRWISENQAEVEASYECGDLCDPVSGTYHLTREGGHWNVSSFEAASAAKPSS
jgi:hypothetical protein